MVGFENAISVIQVEYARAFHLGQEEGENNGLGIRIGKLPVARFRKEEVLDFFFQVLER